MSKSHPARPFRISILEILLLMGTIAIVVAAYRAMSTHQAFRASFGNMPADDRALEEWYHDRKDVLDVRVERKDQELRVEYRSRQMGMLPDLAPFPELGYQPLQTISMESRTEFPLFRMLLSLLALWLIGIFLRRWKRQKMDGVVGPIARDEEQDAVPDVPVI